jgi:hypothetical protein
MARRPEPITIPPADHLRLCYGYSTLTEAIDAGDEIIAATSGKVTADGRPATIDP